MAVIRLSNENAENNLTEIIVHFCKTVKNPDNGTEFDTYKVEIGNKLVDLRWKRDVNTAEFKGLKKFKVTVKDFNEGKNFVYPRYYAGGIVGDIIELA